MLGFGQKLPNDRSLSLTPLFTLNIRVISSVSIDGYFFHHSIPQMPPLKKHKIKVPILALSLLVVLTTATFATPPAVNTNHPFSFGYYVPATQSTNFNLSEYFTISNPSISNNVFSNTVLVDSTLGNFFVELYPQSAPQTVANFLKYVTNGLYQNMFVQRSVPGFVIQMGGFTLDPSYSQGTYFPAIPTYPAVPSEVSLSNTTGTLAMALGSDTNGNYLTNSGTSQWFVNLTNNTSLNPYFTVFGQVMEPGLSVVGAIAACNTANLSSYSGALGTVPLSGWSTNSSNGISFTNFITIKEMAANPTLPYFAVSSDPESFKTTLKGPNLSVNFLKYPTNLATTQDFVRISVYASDTNGNVTNTSFVVVPYPAGTQSISFPAIPQQVFTTNTFDLNSLFAKAPKASSGLPLEFTTTGPIKSTNGLYYFTGTGTVTVTAQTPNSSPYFYYYKPATPVTVNFLVKSNSQTLGSFGTVPTSPYGQNIQVFPPAATSGLPVSVSVKSGPAKLGGFSNGNYLITPTGIGTVTLAANQIGNPSYIPAPEVTTSFSIVKGTPTVTFPSVTNIPSIPGKTFKLTATSSAKLPISFSSSDTNVISIKGNIATVKSLGSSTLTASTPSTPDWSAAQSSQTVSPQ